MQCIEMTITPEIAKKWLDHSAGNRVLNKRYVKQLVDDIEHGRWELTGQPIILGADMIQLLDGHHRLTACVIANIPIKCMVVIGGHQSTKIDIGNARSTKHSLVMAGKINAKHALHDQRIMALIKMAYAETMHDARPTSELVYEYYNQHSDSIDCVREIIGGNCKRGINQASVLLAMFAALENGVEFEVVKSWFDIVNTGTYDKNTIRSLPASRCVARYSRSLVGPMDASGSGRTLTMKKTMSSIYHYDRNESVTKFYGSTFFKIPGLNESKEAT